MVIASVLVIVGATTFPEGVAGGSAELQLGLVPGLADMIRNVLLFVPLGAGLALSGRSIVSSSRWAVLLSSMVELAQLLIPGRFTSPWDVLSNAVGAAVGAGLVVSASRLIWPSSPEARRLTLAMTAAYVVGIPLVALGSQPCLPEARYFSHWTPEFEHLEHYAGRVLAVSIDAASPPHGWIDDTAKIRAEMSGDFRLTVSVDAGPQTSALAPLFMLTDEREREVLLLGVDGEDLVFRLRDWAAAVGLERWGLRLDGALRQLGRGDSFVARIERAGSRFCVEIGETRSCDLGFTLGSGWTSVAPVQSIGRLGLMWSNAAWVGICLLPLGYWYRHGWASGVSISAVFASMFGAPLWGGLLPTPPTELLGGWVGFIAGIVLWRYAGAARMVGREVPS